MEIQKHDQQFQPIFILPEDTKRTTGKDAQRNNIAAAKAVAQTVRTTLGPKGMDEIIVDSLVLEYYHPSYFKVKEGATEEERLLVTEPTAERKIAEERRKNYPFCLLKE